MYNPKFTRYFAHRMQLGNHCKPILLNNHPVSYFQGSVYNFDNVFLKKVLFLSHFLLKISRNTKKFNLVLIFYQMNLSIDNSFCQSADIINLHIYAMAKIILSLNQGICHHSSNNLHTLLYNFSCINTALVKIRYIFRFGELLGCFLPALI